MSAELSNENFDTSVFASTIADDTLGNESQTIDFRREWIKKRVLIYFGEEDEELFEQMCSRNDNKVGKKMVPFLEEEDNKYDLETKLFVVFKTYYDKVINEEVVVAEEGIITF